jgi:hypothetical protein
MKTTELFKKASSKQINETMSKTFGQKLDFDSLTMEQLEDARNKLRTHLHQARQNATFNENVENEAVTKAQWMLDAINAEIAERSENSDVAIEEDGTTEETEMRIRESATDKASAVVTAKTMVDRVGRWIEELAGMENDQLIQLGDTIRDEMGQEQAKAFLSAVAPAIQQALQNLKATRETLATGVRSLTGEEQSAELIGSEPAPGAEAPEGFGDEFGGEAGADAMNGAPEGFGDEEPALGAADEFGASEPAVGGAEEAGRAKRESIDYGNKLMKVLAG